MKKPVMCNPGDVDPTYTGKNGGGTKKMMDPTGLPTKKTKGKKKKKKVNIELEGKALFAKRHNLKY